MSLVRDHMPPPLGTFANHVLVRLKYTKTIAINTQLNKLEITYFIIENYFSKKWLVYEPKCIR